MPTTPLYALRYPLSTDTADVVRDLTNLATDVDNALGPKDPTGLVAGEAAVWNGTAWARSSVTKLGIGSLAGYPSDATKYLAGDGTWQTTPSGTLPGMVSMYAGAAAPTGWLLCDGSAVSRTTYAALFAAIGTVYGTGDGSTTFNLPDLRGRVPVGKAASGTFVTLGVAGGEETHLLSTAEMPAHAHGVNDPTHGHGVNDPGHTHTYTQPANGNYYAGGSVNGDNSYFTSNTSSAGTGISIAGNATGITIQNNGGGGTHNNLQPYRVVNFIVKT